MNCPVCDTKLRAVEKMGVEVDICPDCKGVWLDRGELEKLIELASSDGAVRERPTERPRAHEDDHRRRDDDHHGHDDRGHGDHGHGGHNAYGNQKRKGSWLADVLGSFGGGED